MKTLTEQLSNMLRTDLSEQCSSAAYAVMVDGEILAEDSMGKNPIRGGTYNVGSISKVYCAVAVMQLVERGLVSLDRPVCEYLPRFVMPDERYRQITLRHCLSHSSGLPGTQWRWLAAGSPRKEDYYDEVYRFLAHSALHSAPGEFSVYCNDGFTLAEMVVSAVANISYGEYCKTYITEPIGACSSRQSSQRNQDYSHTSIVGMPLESIGPEGAGGIGTTMADLCKFGQLFLTENAVIGEESKKEIDKPQGVTFLPEDGWTGNYGLGWDCVNMPHRAYFLGSGVLDKGGGTVEFSSRLIVIPKYKAVLAISATVDCGIDVKEEILELFALAMLSRGENVTKNCRPIPKDMIEKCQGLYLASGKFMQVSLDGFRADITLEDSKGETVKLDSNLLYDGEKFSSKMNQYLHFSEYRGKIYLMANVHEKSHPLAVKADCCGLGELSDVWKARIGRKYIISNVFSDDIVGNLQMNGFQLNITPKIPNLLVASFASQHREGEMPGIEVPVTPYIDGKLSDVLACGAVNIPYHAGRDQMNLYFEDKDGVEYCECSGYIYQDVTTLERYNGQKWADGPWNQVYVIDTRLEQLPEIPEGRRVLLFDEQLHVIYDSFMKDTFKPLEKGYISFI